MLHRLAVLTVVLLLVAMSGMAFAQGTATLRGEVNDAYGSAIPAAEVTATNYDTGAEVTGDFFFRNPNTRGGVFTADRGRTLLIGDAAAARGDPSANCPTVAVTEHVPDPFAMGRVLADPDLFISNTVNASLGPEMPTYFDLGSNRRPQRLQHLSRRLSQRNRRRRAVQRIHALGIQRRLFLLSPGLLLQEAGAVGGTLVVARLSRAEPAVEPVGGKHDAP